MQAHWLDLPAINSFEFDSLDFEDDFASITWSSCNTWVNSWTDVLKYEKKMCLYIEDFVLFHESSGDNFAYSATCSNSVLCSYSVVVTYKCNYDGALFLLCYVTTDMVEVWVWDPGENQ